MTPEYPEHDKLQSVKHKRDVAQDFLDWMRRDQGFVLCVPHEHDEGCQCNDTWHLGPLLKPTGFLQDETASCPTCCSGDRDRKNHECGYIEFQYERRHLPAEKILGMYLGIDPDKLEQEKAEMLDFMRELNRG